MRAKNKIRKNSSSLFLFLLFILLCLFRQSALVFSLDQTIYLWAQDLSYSTPWLKFWEVVTAVGEGYFVYPLVAVPALTHLFKNRSRAALAFVALMVLLFFINPLLKNFFVLPRPVSLSPYTDLVTYTFPSGHAVNAVLLLYFLPRFAALVFEGKKSFHLVSAWFFVPGIVLIALSRVMLGVHWFSDVVAGVCLGALISGILLKLWSLCQSKNRTGSLYRAVIFDLDGTLIDSKQDIVTATNATLVAMGGQALPADLVASYVGHGVRDLVRGSLQAAGVVDREEETLNFFREFYLEHCLDSTVLFPGVQKLLDDLKQQGIKMAVFTNKPQIYTDRILSGLGISHYFAFVLGSDNGFPNKPDLQGSGEILRQLDVTASQTLMVGDSDVDLKTAQNAGMGCALYLMGFVKAEIILGFKTEARLVFEDFSEVFSLVMRSP